MYVEIEKIATGLKKRDYIEYKSYACYVCIHMCTVNTNIWPWMKIAEC